MLLPSVLGSPPMTVDAGSRSMPIAAFPHGGSLVIATDDGEWLRLGTGESLEPMTATGPMSDVVAETDGTITVACWSPELRQLRHGPMSPAWSTISLSAPATALAATPRGLVIADTGGGLSLLTGAARVPVQELSSPEPILSLVWVGSLVALGASGTVEVSTWPVVEGGLVPIHTGTIGRAHAIFAGIRPGSALVAGARGIATLDADGTRPRIVAVTTDLKERISGAAVFADRQRALVYADSGDAWIVDEGLVRANPVRLSAGVIGAAPSGDGGVLAWTADGALHTIGSDGATWRVTGDDVVLAVADPGRTGSVAIHWSKSGGTRVTRGHVAWN
jgi:hypothetical protein